MSIPRALHVVSFALMGVLLAAAVYLCVTFALYQLDPEPVVGADLSPVLLVLAAGLLVPAVAALGLWGAGFAIRRRYPRSALALVVASAVVAGLAALAVLSLYLGGPQV